MTTKILESKLKADCTPEIIKKMVELAEGFEKFKLRENYDPKFWIDSDLVFPLLIHRAVEGWNKSNNIINCIIVEKSHLKFKAFEESEIKHFENYQPQSLTQAECAMLDCLLEVLK